jgi:uncharacterized protein YdhG (YjbR/CyaY superfamily)
VLERVRAAIRRAAPEAEERISYGIPLYIQQGHLVGFGAFKRHCSLFVTSSEVGRLFASELEPFDVSHTTIHFRADSPLPDDLVEKIVRARIAENEAAAAR